MRLDELTDRFLEANRHTFHANTRRAYRADLRLFARSFPTLETADLAAEHLRAFLAAADRAPPRSHAAVRPYAPVTPGPTATGFSPSIRPASWTKSVYPSAIPAR